MTDIKKARELWAKLKSKAVSEGWEKVSSMIATEIPLSDKMAFGVIDEIPEMLDELEQLRSPMMIVTADGALPVDEKHAGDIAKLNCEIQLLRAENEQLKLEATNAESE